MANKNKSFECLGDVLQTTWTKNHNDFVFFLLYLFWNIKIKTKCQEAENLRKSSEPWFSVGNMYRQKFRFPCQYNKARPLGLWPIEKRLLSFWVIPKWSPDPLPARKCGLLLFQRIYTMSQDLCNRVSNTFLIIKCKSPKPKIHQSYKSLGLINYETDNCFVYMTYFYLKNGKTW